MSNKGYGDKVIKPILPTPKYRDGNEVAIKYDYDEFRYGVVEGDPEYRVSVSGLYHSGWWYNIICEQDTNIRHYNEMDLEALPRMDIGRLYRFDYIWEEGVEESITGRLIQKCFPDWIFKTGEHKDDVICVYPRKIAAGMVDVMNDEQIIEMATQFGTAAREIIDSPRLRQKVNEAFNALSADAKAEGIRRMFLNEQYWCPCESSKCDHEPGRCTRDPHPNIVMQFLGNCCQECAANMSATGGGDYIHHRFMSGQKVVWQHPATRVKYLATVQACWKDGVDIITDLPVRPAPIHEGRLDPYTDLHTSYQTLEVWNGN